MVGDANARASPTERSGSFMRAGYDAQRERAVDHARILSHRALQRRYTHAQEPQGPSSNALQWPLQAAFDGSRC